MKHLRLFENFENIDQICINYGIENYTINSDGTVDVSGDVHFYDKGLGKLPIKFGKVSGDFSCTGNFFCSKSNLFTLEGGPSYVGGDFTCYDSQLWTLEGGPKEVGGDFYCNNNRLRTLKGGPSYVGGDFSCSHNILETLEGGPKEVGGFFDCSDNPISAIYNLFRSYKEYTDSQDYNYLRGKNIVKSRLEEALEEIGKKLTNLDNTIIKIAGYNYI